MVSMVMSQKCPENEKVQKSDNYYKEKHFDCNCFHCGNKEHRVEHFYVVRQ